MKIRRTYFFMVDNRIFEYDLKPRDIAVYCFLCRRLNREEKKAMVERMKEAAAPSMRAFVLDMCMHGKVIVNSDLRELNQELRYQGNKRVNALLHDNRTLGFCARNI